MRKDELDQLVDVVDRKIALAKARARWIFKMSRRGSPAEKSTAEIVEEELMVVTTTVYIQVLKGPKP